MNHVGEGGAALALYDLVFELRSNYNHLYEPIVVTGCHNELNDMLSSIGVKNYWSSYKNFLSSYRAPLFIWKNLARIRYWLNKPLGIYKLESCIDFKTIDIIHSNLDRIDIGAYFSRKYGIPHIWHIRENAKGDFRLMSVFSNPIRHMTKYNSVFITISKAVTNNWLSYGIPESSIRLIYDGIRTEPFNNINHIRNEKVRFIFLGGYSSSKGQHVLLEAIEALPLSYKNEMLVDFYGNGDNKYKKALMGFVRRKELQSVVSIKDYNSLIYKILGEYDIGVNCSRNEGFGRITVEYMMAGLCPLVSDTGANVEIVEDNKSGLLFKYSQIESLTDKIKYIIDHRTIIEELSISAKNRSYDLFSMRKHTEQIVNLYNEL